MGFANWWDQAVVSRIVKCGCGSERMTEMRRHVIPLASGRVFELGIGAGANLPLYDPARVTSYSAVDPSTKLLEFARAEAMKLGWQTDIQPGLGEALPYDEDSFDTVVCTFTMCSVDDQMRALSELRRVLRPGGQLLYAEHGRAPDADVVRWQERLEPVWKRVMGNCHLTRPVTSAIERAGFAASPMAREYLTPGPRWAGWMEWGSAVKPG
jgi:ubiquinone/menaquinone biosynthesis C-methylase UbiE